MIQKDKTYNLATFFCLYIAQRIPMSFFSTVIPVMMRQEDFSLSAIGLLQLIKLPWILKFLWSPMVDRHAVTTGDYKRWIFSSELIYAGLIFAVAFLDFHTDFYTIVALIIISFVASATQDIATDALAVLAFSRKDKSLANSMQSMGSFGGSMIGGGVLLLLFKQIGWNGLLPCVALFVIAALLPLFFNKGIRIQPKEAHERAKKADVIYFFARRSIWKQIGFLFLYYSGLIGTLAMLKPWLVDLGYDMKEIGVMSGVAGTLLRASDDAHALRRDFPSVGQLRDGDDRGLYDGNGLCTPRARRDGFHDPDGHHASQRHVDGHPEWKNCRSYGLSRTLLLRGKHRPDIPHLYSNGFQ